MIKNGRDVLLTQNSGTLPDVSGAMENWFQKMIFNILTKEVVNHVLKETSSELEFRGVWQALKGQALYIKPEGQRNWKWFQVHSDTDLVLKTDDVVRYLGVNYRVMDKTDQSLYGYYEYHLVEDFIDA